MQKTVMQLEILRVIIAREGGKDLSTELNFDYWKDGLTYLREAEINRTTPTLFDIIDDV